MKEIGLLIRNLRLNDGLTQQEFVEMCDIPIHVNTLQNLESGTKNVTLLSLLIIINQTGLTLSQFFEGME